MVMVVVIMAVEVLVEMPVDAGVVMVVVGGSDGDDNGGGSILCVIFCSQH